MPVPGPVVVVVVVVVPKAMRLVMAVPMLLTP